MVRIHVQEVTLDESLEKKDEFSEAVHVQWPRTWSLMASRSTSFTFTDLKPDVFVEVSMNEVNKERRLRR